MVEQRANLAVTTLAANISTTPVAGTSESWLVASTALPFPQTGTYRATIGPNSDTSPEIVLITAVNDSTHFQVQRGAESSTIKTHTSGDTFAHTLTAGALGVAVWTDKANTWTTGAQDLTAATSLLVPASAGAAPTADGSLAYDTTQDAWKGGGAGALSGTFPRVLSVQQPAADTLTNTTVSEQAFATSFTIPANFLITDKILRVTANFKNVGSGSPPTLLFKVKAGATVIFSMGAASLGATSLTRSFTSHWLIFGRAAASASAAVETSGVDPSLPINPTANATAQPVNLATNGTLAVTLTLTYGATGSADTVSLRQLLVEELN